MAQRNLSAVPEAHPKIRQRKTRTRVQLDTPKLEDSERDTLVMLRDQLKARIADAPTHAIARLIKEFREVDKEIRALDAKAQHEAEEAAEVADEAWSDDEI